MLTKKSQKGGKNVLPIRYFNPNQSVPKYYPSGSPQLDTGNSAYGPNVGVSYGVSTGEGFNRMNGPNLGPYPNSTKTQTGGFNKIVNPDTGRKVSIHSKTGKQVLKSYIRALK